MCLGYGTQLPPLPQSALVPRGNMAIDDISRVCPNAFLPEKEFARLLTLCGRQSL